MLVDSNKQTLPETGRMNTAELEPDQMPKAIVNRLFAEFLNKGYLSVADQLVSPDFNGPGGKGPDGFKAMISPLRQGFPDLHFTIQDMVVEGSRRITDGSLPK